MYVLQHTTASTDPAQRIRSGLYLDTVKCSAYETRIITILNNVHKPSNMHEVTNVIYTHG